MNDTLTPYVRQLLQTIRERGADEACWFQGNTYRCSDLMADVEAWQIRMREHGIGSQSVVALVGDWSPQTTAFLLALMSLRAISVPLSQAVHREMDSLLELANVELIVRFADNDTFIIEKRTSSTAPKLLKDFGARNHPGLIVFTSGSTGTPKGILHDCERVAKKFEQKRRAYRTLMFLLFDHFGGFNTFLGALAYGGTMIMVRQRTPQEVARAIGEAKAELLPVTPTFLNLMLAAGLTTKYEMASVKLITYGTEAMPEATLKAVRREFPHAQLQQTYGLSELGVLRSKSLDSDSLWVKLGGPGFETKIVDGVLYVRSESAMVGYLNAPSPFDEEGWMSTGDHVSVEGEYLKILGRKSDLINVGGLKVFPSEIETVLLEADNVVEASVFAENHPLMGKMIVARVCMREPEDPSALKARLRKHCLAKLAAFKVPVRFIQSSAETFHTERFKKVRATETKSHEA